MKNLINKSELISKLQTLEGLTNDERSSLIGLLRQHKKYGLVWEDKPEDVEERLREELPILREVKDKAILSDETDAPNHILIEGDNLEALTALSYTHEGKIDVIYIDPPYNTGNKDFVYYDDFNDDYRNIPYVEREDAYRHSKWLSFMDRRLKIAKKLLSDKGVIFLSIDDNEQANLKILCDEVFGENNFAGVFIWEQGRKSMAAQFAVNHEYCLVYCKQRNDLIAYDSSVDQSNWREKKDGLSDIYKEFDKLSKYYGMDFSSIEIGMRKFFKELPDNHPAKRQSQYRCVDSRGLYFPGDIAQGTGNGGRFDIIHPTTGKPCKVPKGGWRFGEAKLPSLLSSGRIHFGPDENTVPCLKRYLKETEFEVMSSVFYKDGRGATKRLETLLGANLFDHPKDEDIIAKFVRAVTSYQDNRKYTILDFFAGSGTTLHATMQLNAEDGGHRQCILVTNNENNICEEVTYERNKRVINGYTTPKGVEVAGLKANTLRYYKTDYISRDRTQKNMRELVAAATDLLCIKEDLYEERKTFGRFKLKPQLARYFNNGNRHMLIVYREELIDEIAEEIKSLDFGKMRLKIYVFSPGRYAFTDNFREVEDKVELVALPAAIYDAYQKVLPKRREKLFEDEKEEIKIPTDLFEGQGI